MADPVHLSAKTEFNGREMKEWRRSESEMDVLTWDKEIIKSVNFFQETNDFG